MTLVLHSHFAQELLGLKSSFSSIFDSFNFPWSTETTVLKSNDISSSLFYETNLNLTGFEAKDIKIKLGRTYIDVCANRKIKGETSKDYFKMTLNRRLEVPKGVAVQKALIYLTGDHQLIIKVPVEKLKKHVKGLSKVISFHKYLNKFLSSKNLDKTKQSVTVTLYLPKDLQVSVKIENGCLIVEGTSENTQYYRSIPLPECVDKDKIEYNQSENVLNVQISYKQSYLSQMKELEGVRVGDESTDKNSTKLPRTLESSDQINKDDKRDDQVMNVISNDNKESSIDQEENKKESAKEGSELNIERKDEGSESNIERKDEEGSELNIERKKEDSNEEAIKEKSDEELHIKQDDQLNTEDGTNQDEKATEEKNEFD